MPHGKKRCRLQLLFLCLIVTDLHSPVVVLIYSVDANHLRFLLVFCRCSPFRTPSFTGFCSRTLSSLRCLPSVTRQSSGVCYLYIFVSYAAIGACASTGRLISFNCFCGSYVVPVFRIVWITLSILQAITISDCIFFNGLLGRVV